MRTTRILFSHEYPEHLRVGFVGCGGQAFRNLLPSLAYAPVLLIATCDVKKERALACARQFGGERAYDDFDEMLRTEKLDAVFLATGYDETGRPLYPQMAIKAMRAGCHAWIEKPPAWSLSEIEEMASISVETNREIGVGFMKMFGAGVQKVKHLMMRSEFGGPTSVGLRDPEALPPLALRGDPLKMLYFLDHIVHPISLLHFLMGPVERFHVMRESHGASVISFAFLTGACGYLHMPWGQSSNCPKERLEVVGAGANILLENNNRLTYYRPSQPGQTEGTYGRVGDFTGDCESAPLHWEMDCYSGQPFNNPLFFAGYAPEIIHFTKAILAGGPPTIGTLGDAWHVLRLFEAIKGASVETVQLNSAPDWTLRR